MKGKKLLNKACAMLLAVIMVFGMLPVSVLAGEHDSQVHVVIENSTFSEDDGAVWDGVLVDTWVNLSGTSTMMSCVVDALGDLPQVGAEDNYVSSINGLNAFDGGEGSGWMGTLNDWFTNEGFGGFSVEAGTLAAYDEIHIMYTCNYGEDLGGTWSNNEKTLSALSFSAGSLDSEFSSTKTSYTLTVPEGTTSLKITPTATNKNFQVRSYLGTQASGTEYKRTYAMPVENGSVITVVCGDPSWPSMNGGSYGEADSLPAQTYTINVVYEKPVVGQVQVIIENDKASAEAGAAWTGALVNTSVDVTADSTMLSCVQSALADAGKTCTVSYGYISEIGGLGAGVGGSWAGWMGTLNDWFTSSGLDNYKISDGTLGTGDVIRMIYSLDGGADSGSSFTSNDKSLTSLSFSVGRLSPSFDKAANTYTLTLPSGTAQLQVNPVAANKNFQVRTYLGTQASGTEYKRSTLIPVTEGSVITVVCGDPSWQTMNNGEYGSGAENLAAVIYTVNIAYGEANASPIRKSGVAAQDTHVMPVGESYGLDLSTIFEDDYSSSLIYKVSVNGAAAEECAKAYAFAPTDGGKYTLVFTASDGSLESSDTYTVTVSAYEELTSNVTVSMQDSNSFSIIPQTVAVSSSLAESYGYVDEVYDAVSTLDVLVKAEQMKYGDGFTKGTAGNYLTVNNGSISKVNGVSTYSFSFAVDRVFPYDPNSEYNPSYGYTGYNVAQTAVANGSSVDFFSYRDSMFMDYYTWFEQNGAYVSSVTVKENQSFDVKLYGFMYMFGSYTKEDMLRMNIMGNVCGAQLAVVNAETGALSDISGVTTDETTGVATLSFQNEGTYYVSAYSDYDETYQYITSPWLKVTVEKDLSGVSDLVVRTSTGTSNLSNAILAGANDEGVAVFDKNTLTYDLGNILTDGSTQLRFWYTLPEAGSTVTLNWGDGQSKVLTAASSASTTIANVWANCLSPGKNTVTMTVTPPAGSQTEQKVYTLKIGCIPRLSSLSAAAGSTPLYFDKTFNVATSEYTLTLPNSAQSVTFTAAGYKDGYSMSYNGNASNTVDVSNANKVDIVVTAGSGENAVTNTYTVTLNKVQQLSFKPVVTPSDAAVAVYDQNGSPVAKNTDGTYSGLFGEAEYTYTATKYDYVAQSGAVPAAGGQLEITLAKAADDGLADVNSEWKNFRNSDSNMGITDVKTPVSTEDTSLLWNKKLGTGWSAAPSVQIIVDNSLVTMVGSSIYKLDLETGETIASATMAAAINFGYTPPTYAEGMIFCPLANGTVQAFNAETLESLWIYKDSLKGQSLSPITYSDGYIYTGFWNGETKAANFVCISVTDEDTQSADETKVASWKYSHNGGFYWAGALALGDYVIVGSDDGTSGSAGTSYLYSFNKYTGELVGSAALENAGDQRSCIAYDSASGKVYFTTKGGYLYSASIDKATGAISGLNGVNYNAQSTSTPVVYDGKVYFATGSGISSTGSSGNFVVADASSLQMLYAVGMKGYPQCSMLLSTAYEDEGYLYFYSTYNANPGGISMLKVKNGATTADDVTLTELYDAAGFSQYCITSIICGNDGTLYYKNDSCNIFAVGVPKYTTVINLINNIGTVTKDSGSLIKVARDAYDALSDENKAKVTNYQTLLEAEAAFNALQSNEVIVLINAIGDVSLNSETAINAAINAYNGLSEAQKALVSNYGVLESAVTKLSELKAGECDRLINAIGEVTLEREGAIVAARSSYTVLTEAQKTLVHNLSVLEAAENKLAQLKQAAANAPEGSTASVTVTIDSVTYQISEQTNAVIKGIEALNIPAGTTQLTGEQEAAVLQLYRNYSALTADEKLFVTNYEQLQKFAGLLGESYHFDKVNNISALDNDEKVLPWYAKLTVKSAVVGEKELAEIKKVLGDDAKMPLLFDISFTDMLTGKEFKPEGNVVIKIPKPSGNYNSVAVVHIKDDGTYEYIQGSIEGDYVVFNAGSFSMYGAAVFSGAWENVVPKAAATKSNNWLWIAGIGIGVVAIGLTLFFRRKNALTESDDEN